MEQFANWTCATQRKNSTYSMSQKRCMLLDIRRRKCCKQGKKIIYLYKELYRSQYTEDTLSARLLHEDRTYPIFRVVILASLSNRFGMKKAL